MVKKRSKSVSKRIVSSVLPGLQSGKHAKNIHLIKSELNRLASIVFHLSNEFGKVRGKDSYMSVYEPHLSSVVRKLDLLENLFKMINTELKLDNDVRVDINKAKSIFKHSASDFDAKMHNVILENVKENIKSISADEHKEIELGNNVLIALHGILDASLEICRLPKRSTDIALHGFYASFAISAKQIKESVERLSQLISAEKKYFDKLNNTLKQLTREELSLKNKLSKQGIFPFKEKRSFW